MHLYALKTEKKNDRTITILRPNTQIRRSVLKSPFVPLATRRIVGCVFEVKNRLNGLPWSQARSQVLLSIEYSTHNIFPLNLVGCLVT